MEMLRLRSQINVGQKVYYGGKILIYKQYVHFYEMV